MDLPAHITDTADEIRELEIQGATAVAVESVKALQQCWEDEQDEELLQAAAEHLLATRPTEPGLQNAVHQVVGTKEFDATIEHFDDAREKINEHGAGLIDEGDVVFTHCRSSTVEHIIKHAAADRDLSVRNTETRPVLQGRKTARKLAEAGIPVTHTVDSAGHHDLQGADIALLGADAVAADGTVYNKIGSELMALAAADDDVPLYVCTDSWKFAPQTLHGGAIEVEHRDPDEVWEDPPDGVDVQNPAFEAVRPGQIAGIVTELGVIPPEEFADRVGQQYPALTEDRDA